MERQYFYISATGITEEEIMEELSHFMTDLTRKYGEKFGATVLGMTEGATKRVEKILNE